MDTPGPKSPSEMRFSDAIGELEKIVQELESGQLELEESIVRYERGVALLGACRSTLEEAQQKVTSLMGRLEDDPEGLDEERSIEV